MPLLEVAELCSVQWSEKTIWKTFLLEGYSRQVARKKPFLDEGQKRLRFTCAFEHRGWKREYWRRVI